jgi:hypothetical protein
MKSLNYLLLLLLAVKGFGQQKTNFEFRIVDYTTEQTIKNEDVKLVILGNDYGNGPEHYFRDGSVFLHGLPLGKKLSFRIEATNYMYFFPVEEIMITKAFSILPLVKKDDPNIILRGKLLDSVSHAALPGARIEIRIGQYDSIFSIKSDTTGNFVLRIPNGKVLVGHEISISISFPTYKEQVVNSVIKNLTINYFDIFMTKTFHPPKVYIIKFTGPSDYIANVRIMSSYKSGNSEAPYKINPLIPEKGIYQVAVDYNERPDNIKLNLKCKGYNEESVVIALDRLDRSLTDDNGILIFDLKEKIYSPFPTIGIALTPYFSFLTGNILANNSSFGLNAGIIRYFKLFNNCISVELNASVLPMKYKILSNYVTLPGEKGTTETEFNIRALPQMNICYHFGNVMKYKLNYFFGLEVDYYLQSLANSGDSAIDEKYNAAGRLCFGLKTGLSYRISSRFLLAGDITGTPVKLQGITYIFNYFGRASQEYVTNNYFLTKLRLNAIYTF